MSGQNLAYGFSIEKLADLFVPLVGQCVRADHEIQRSFTGLIIFDPRFINHDSQTLNGLTETHVITERAIQPISSKLGHPLDALFLIVSQHCFGVDLQPKRFRVYSGLAENLHEIKAISDFWPKSLLDPRGILRQGQRQ